MYTSPMLMNKLYMPFKQTSMSKILCSDVKKLLAKYVVTGHCYHSPVNRPVDPKQIATEIINTQAFSL